MTTLSDFLIRVDAHDLTFKMKYHPDPVDYKGDPDEPYFEFYVHFEDEEEAECWRLDGDDIGGVGHGLEEAMEQFMGFFADFADIEDYQIQRRKQ